MLLDSGLLQEPMLYPSYCCKKNHLAYYQRLDDVRKGDFEGWITCYLQGICDSAIDALQRAKAIEKLEEEIKHKMTYDAAFYKVREVSNAALEHLLRILITEC